MGYTVSFDIGDKKYQRKLVIDSQRLSWEISDAIDDTIEELCMDIARLLADKDNPLPDDFNVRFYDRVDVGGLRDAVILAAQDVMDCELVFSV